MFSMAESHESRSHTARYREFMRWTRKDEKRFAARFFADVDVTPAHCLSDAGAECLRDCFFRCEARSQMSRREFHRHGICDLAVRENTMKKSITKPINGMLNASALDKINTDADNTHLEFKLCGGEAAPGLVVRPKSQSFQT